MNFARSITFSFSRTLTLLVVMLLTTSVVFAQSTPVQPATLTETTDVATPAEADIVGTLEAEGQYSILLGALRSTGLYETLKAEGPYTLFAPTDAAFQALPPETLNSLTGEALTAILQYHVVMDEVTAEEVAGMETVASAQGAEIKVGEDGTAVNNAQIIQADIEATNGVIHAIDAVLIPEADVEEDEGETDNQ